MARLKRPISPHLSVYRWEVTNTLSIVHRLTGVTLSLGALILTSWLLGIASGPDVYLGVMRWLLSPVGLLVLLALTFGFSYHLCNGVRHLFWDAGYGFDIRRAWASGMATIAGAVALTFIFWLIALASGGN